MKWERTETICFHEGIGSYKESPIGKVTLSVALGGQGLFASVERADGQPCDWFILTPPKMLEGLMEHYGVPVPDVDRAPPPSVGAML